MQLKDFLIDRISLNPLHSYRFTLLVHKIKGNTPVPTHPTGCGQKNGNNFKTSKYAINKCPTGTNTHIPLLHYYYIWPFLCITIIYGLSSALVFADPLTRCFFPPLTVEVPVHNLFFMIISTKLNCPREWRFSQLMFRAWAFFFIYIFIFIDYHFLFQVFMFQLPFLVSGFTVLTFGFLSLLVLLACMSPFSYKMCIYENLWELDFFLYCISKEMP